MSYYKEQLKNYLGNMGLQGDSVLSIGAQHDDRKYFAELNYKEWKTLDVNEDFKPDYLWNMNREIMDGEGDTAFHDVHEHFDIVLAFELWEYIYDPVVAHKNIFALLKPGGTYMGSYPFIYPHHNPVGQDYLRYTDWAIKKLMTVAGFREIKITPRVATKGKLELQEFVLAEGMRLSKELTNYEWPIGYIVEGKK